MVTKVKASVEKENELSSPETLDGNYVSIAEFVSFFAILDLRNGIELANDALGHRENVTIGGINGVMETPTLSNKVGAGCRLLVPPKAATTWKCGNDPLFWGQEIAYPDGIVRLPVLLIEFQVPASKLHDHSTSVQKFLESWYSTFVDFHDLLTKHPIARVSRSSDSAQHELFILDADNRKSVPYQQILRFSSPITCGRYAVSKANFIEICRLCSIGSQPSLPYRFQLLAYRALLEKDYRKAVIESAVAAEIVLTKAIVESTGSSYDDKKEYQTLGGRLKLAKKVGLALPDVNLWESVINPRNQAVHEAKVFESSEAYSVVKAVDQLLQMLSPQIHEQTYDS